MQQWHALADALLELERELRALGLWSSQRPSAAELSSQEPFCLDTLEFDKWLQWVFIPRMAAMIEAGGSMPPDCNIQPMAEESLAHLGRRRHELLSILGRIDRLARVLAGQG